MAQNANGTPSSPDNIPKFLGSDLINITSTSSINTMVDGVQTALNTRVTDPSHVTNGGMVWNGSAWTNAKLGSSNFTTDSLNTFGGVSGLISSPITNPAFNSAMTSVAVNPLSTFTAETWLLHMWVDVSYTTSGNVSSMYYGPTDLSGATGFSFVFPSLPGIQWLSIGVTSRQWLSSFALVSISQAGTISFVADNNQASSTTITVNSGGISATRIRLA